MPLDTFLASDSTKLFLRIHKIRIIEHHVAGHPIGLTGKKITPHEISAGISRINSEHKNVKWISDSLDAIAKFLAKHKFHDLCLYDDMGDLKWNPENPGYCDWKEEPGPNTTELFLPRNLIHDLNIKTWDEAEKYLKSLEIYLFEELELTEFKRMFDQESRNMV